MMIEDVVCKGECCDEGYCQDTGKDKDKDKDKYKCKTKRRVWTRARTGAFAVLLSIFSWLELLQKNETKFIKICFKGGRRIN